MAVPLWCCHIFSRDGDCLGQDVNITSAGHCVSIPYAEGLLLPVQKHQCGTLAVKEITHFRSNFVFKSISQVLL